MRHPYTPVFRDLLTSSIWITDPPTRCVWIWFLLMADPEGYVAATLPGLANAANVTLEQAQAAVALLESPDPYSATKALQGVRLVRVDRGWHIVNFVAFRERAKEEALKARKRAWAQQKRAEGKQLTLPGVEMDPPEPLASVVPANDVDGCRQTVDAPKRKPKPTLPQKGEGSPLPLEGTFEAPTLPVVCRTLPDSWEPSAELIEEATIQGVPPAELEARIAQLRTGPIGGTRGVLAHKLDTYIRSQFGKWRAWAEVDRAKALSRAAEGAPKRFGGGGRSWEPTDAHKRFAERHGLELGPLADAYRRSGEPEQRGGGKDADDAFAKRLVKAKRDRARGAAA